MGSEGKEGGGGGGGRYLTAAEQKALLERPARRQATEVRAYAPVMSGDYNIWYHRYAGYEYRESRRERGTLTRCVAARDIGRTRAGSGGGGAVAALCIHFALGNCVKGPLCTYRHALPNDDDERRIGITHDVFGRERFKTDRDDMGGVGSFSRENRTLYVSGLKADITPADYEPIVRRHFGEWGELEYVRVLPQRGIGFVRYRLRTAAEFAKVAMGDQSLDDEEVLNIRWAHVDPNPIAKAADDQAITAKAVHSLEQAAAALTPEQRREKVAVRQAQLIAENPLAYPNTDAQFAAPPPAKIPATATEEEGGGGQKVTTHVDYKYTFAPATKMSTLPSKPNPTAAERYVPNPDTGELHPYAMGLIYPRQATERHRPTAAEHQHQVDTLERQYDTALLMTSYTEGAEAGEGALLPTDPDHDEPGYHNDAPLF